MLYSNNPVRTLLLAGSLATALFLAPMANAQSTKVLQQEINALTAIVNSQGQQITALQSTVASQGLTINSQGQKITTLQGQVSTLNTQVTSLNTQLSTLSTSINAVNGLASLFSVSGKDLYLTGNLHIVNGTGDTYFNSNGLGNLFLGYQSSGTVAGSHNLILGKGNSVSQNANIVSGQNNSSFGFDEVILSGLGSKVYGSNGYCVGGYNDIELPDYAGQIGGEAMQVSDLGTFGVTVGGESGVVEGPHCSIIGGADNTVAGFGENVIVGGNANTIDGGDTFDSVICAGQQDHIDVADAFIGAGEVVHVSGQAAGALGGNTNTITSFGVNSAIIGGQNENMNTGYYGQVGASQFPW